MFNYMFFRRETLSQLIRSPISNGSIGVFFLSLLLLAIHLSGVKMFVFAGHIEIALWDVVGFGLAGLFGMWLGATRGRIHGGVIQGLAIASVFTIWVAFAAFRSPQPVRGFTMVVLLLRDLVLFAAIGAFLAYLPRMGRINRIIFLMGVAIATTSVLLFVYLMQDFSSFVGTRRPFYGSILLIDEFQIPRLIGFARDPNFFALWMSLSLFCGLVSDGLKWHLKAFGFAVIAISLVLTLSRSFFIFFGISFFVLALLFIVRGRLSVASSYLWSLLALATIPVVALLSLAKGGVDLVDDLVLRFQVIGSSPRFEDWALLFSNFENVFLGEGLRSAEVVLVRYSHNSYLDALFETGLVGLALWGVFLVATTWRGLRAAERDLTALPWFHAWVLTLFMFIGFSLVYHPFPWLLAAILWSRPVDRPGSFADPREADSLPLLPERPLVSVLVGTRNRPTAVSRCISSILSQEYAPLEILVADDGDSDRRANLPSDSRLRILPRTAARGVAESRNRLMRNAKGNILIVLDDDAILGGTKAVTGIVDAFRNNPPAGIVATHVVNHVGGREDLLVPFSRLARRRRPSIVAQSQRVSYFVGTCHAIRREILERCDSYPEKLVYGEEELDLSYRVIEAGHEIFYAADVVVHHFPATAQHYTVSTIVGRKRPARRGELYFHMRNRVFLAYQYLPVRYAVPYVAVWMGRYALRSVRELALRDFLLGVITAGRDLRSFTRKPLRRDSLSYLRKNNGRLWY